MSETILTDKLVLHKNIGARFFDNEINELTEKIYEVYKKIVNKKKVIEFTKNCIFDTENKLFWYLPKINGKLITCKTVKKCIDKIKQLNTNWATFSFEIPTVKQIEKLHTLIRYRTNSFEFFNASALLHSPVMTKKMKKYKYKFVQAKIIVLLSDFSNLDEKSIFFHWFSSKLKPVISEDESLFNELFNKSKNYIFDGKNIKIITSSQISITTEEIKNFLINEDYKRAVIMPYNEKMLEDINQGHWSLWPLKIKDKKDYSTILFNKKLVGRDPASSIVNGVVGIDFGTKSTVVVYQKDSVKIHPLRIGTGDYTTKVTPKQYENPTVVEFNDIKTFMEAYRLSEGRPYTNWEDLTISHTAEKAMLNSSSKDYNSFFAEIKQWAGEKNKKFKIVDKKGTLTEVPSFLESKNRDINPIEIYAYYIGLYINNMHNGIFLNYILSFPVTYEIKIREKILKSFEKGLKKSLPLSLHLRKDIIEKFKVIQGASEPAAYAVTALEEYGFQPANDEVVFYGVFDFGGGTTDFDFGIFREADPEKERRYDYVIEHFGSGGDRYLGGENLLDLLAFEIFKKNKDKLLNDGIQFTLPPEQEEFLGSEALLSDSREAKINMNTLAEALRKFWEIELNKDGNLASSNNQNNSSNQIKINLLDKNGENKASYPLTIDYKELKEILKKRIKRGIDTFFEAMRLTINNYEERIRNSENITIFLAGNSSKSKLVKELFDEKIQEEERKIVDEKKIFVKENKFKLFLPLGISETDYEKPTGKTGVAFGLIKSRKGGKILVIDENINDSKKEIPFKFYIGQEVKGKFRTIIKKDVNFNKWIYFIDASIDTFEIFYSSLDLVTTNNQPIDMDGIKKKILNTGIENKEANIYLRIVDPTTIEYVVAIENGGKNKLKQLIKPVKIILEN